jgi:hypothetical protein
MTLTEHGRNMDTITYMLNDPLTGGVQQWF